ncbi:hypothetical protein DFP72DRAFT_1071563 [Ephemerocybe angulata]|uniref:Uncharacterized protein n=1 Tax=Ephemerocybe angulata TaxID=980116 RepID=A0A8H6HRD7_9AGAR|nr:hypothetical protein DFP72DRAFT_1071563 [Tulosesus angulatus]
MTPGEVDKGLDKIKADLRVRAAKLAEASALIEEQLERDDVSPIWLRSLHSRDIGRDVAHLVEDIRRMEKTGRKKDTTWAEGKDKVAKRRVANTMGYKS